MGPGSAAHHAAKTRRAALRPGHQSFLCHLCRTCLRGLAAESARALLSVSPSSRSKGAGKAGRRLAPKVRTRRDARGVTTGDAGHPAFPAQWFYGLWRALPGERCTIAPVALRITDARARSGRLTTASLDAQTPGVRTTRFCRPRTSLPGQPEARACSPPMPKRNAVPAPCRAADRDGSRVSPPCHSVTRRRCRVHRIPAYVS